MNRIENTLAEIDRLRQAWNEGRNADALHAWAARVDGLGYMSLAGLDAAGVKADALVAEIIEACLVHLETHPDDATAHNNLGVFRANGGDYPAARRCFETALRLEAGDWTIHQNLRVLDILAGRAESELHEVPVVPAGRATLAVYFDPHGM